MKSEKRRRQIEEFLLELAEEAERKMDPGEEEINAIAVGAIREYRQESKRTWQAEQGIVPVSS